MIEQTIPAPSSADPLFTGPGEMRARCRAFDWTATPLGPVETWSHSLRTTVGIILASRNPMFLWWGPDLVQFYNDAYRPSFGLSGRHPDALGMRGRECWTDIWDTIGPQIEHVMAGGEATWHEDQYLPILRNGRLEDVWWTYGYSAVRDDHGGINGTLVVCQETTSRIMAERDRERLLGETAAAERTLRETEARLRAIYDGTYEYIGLLTPEGTVLEANRAALEFGGSARADVIGQPFAETVWFAHTPGAPAAVRDAVARASAGEFVRFEMPLRRPGGEWRTFDVSFHPVRDEHGAVVYIVPEGRDITDRHAAEEALRESEQRYRTLFESVDEGFAVIEVIFDDEDRALDYRFLEANPAFERHSGVVGPVGRTARELVPNLEEYWCEIYGHVARTGEPMRFERESDAAQRWFSVFAFRVGRPEERHIAILFSDVSSVKNNARERERLLAALEVERSRLAYVFQQAPSFLAVLRGPTHVFSLVNDAYYQLMGRRDLLGKPVWDALPEVKGQGYEARLDGVLTTGEPFVGREVPVTVARTPGAPPEERFIDLTYMPLVDGDGTRTGIIAHGTDVTDHVHARRAIERLLVEREQALLDAEVARSEAEAARMQAETARTGAEAANRTKGDFLAVMSHELRTPLNAIAGYAELIEMGIRGPVTALQREDLARIQKSQRHLLGLINGVLNYSRAEAGAVHYDIRDVPLDEVLATCETLIAPQASAKQIMLQLTTTDEPVVVRADAEKLQQIVVNLLSNAVKFTSANGEVTLACKRGVDASVLVTVTDSGRGISADALERIFEPFVQVDTRLTRTEEGMGLGLAISRDLARGMGGDLTVTSTLGAGSTFTLALPAAE